MGVTQDGNDNDGGSDYMMPKDDDMVKRLMDNYLFVPIGG